MTPKIKKLLDLIRIKGEVMMEQLDEKDQIRLKQLIELGDVVKIRIGPWSGEPYYGINAENF